MMREVDITILNGTKTTEVLVLLSGGLDSACCLDFYLDLGKSVEAMHISYGQAAEAQELIAAERLSDYYSVRLQKVSWRGLKQKADGNILGRNAFLVFAALMEKPDSVGIIALGIHSGTEYSDCTQGFVRRISDLLSIYAPPRITIGSPFIKWSKGDVFAYARSRKVPIDQTYSCELGGNVPCGSCISCVDIRKLLANAL